MRIESFHIQGFKNLSDVKVEGLADINVFYGLNNVGKSNIFQALAVWSWLLWATSEEISLDQLETEFGPLLFNLNSHHQTDGIKLQGRSIDNEGELAERYKDRFSGSDKIQILSSLELNLLRNNNLQYQVNSWIDAEIARGDMTESGFKTYYQPERINAAESGLNIHQFLNFHIIKSSRRFQVEQSEKGGHSGPISDHNLKQALFYAYLSRDLQQKRRLEAIKRLLAEPPFDLGELDVALDPETDRIDIGFVRPAGRLPLENMGSGVQQLLLVLGQIFLNDYPIIAIEEPEMNLSPQYQKYLLVALRRLMQDPSVKLNQLFISTHSPYFEFEENFFDVTMAENGATHVERLAIEKRDRYFPDKQVGQETGGRLNSLNQVTLYEGVIEDLGLQRGDLVLFSKNEAGRWEIRPEREITQELAAIFDDKEE